MLPSPEPGDLILVKSEGPLFALARRLGGNPYDHVAIVSGDRRTINIDKPRVRVLPLDRLLRSPLHPRILRPRFADAEERSRFVGEIERLVRAPYDVRRTLWLVERIFEQRLLGRARPLAPLGSDRRAWICTDAVLLALERHVSGFSALRELPLDWVALGSGTTNDLLEISRRRPDLLAEVALPGPAALQKGPEGAGRTQAHVEERG